MWQSHSVGGRQRRDRALGLSTELTGVSTGNGEGHLHAELGKAEAGRGTGVYEFH